jgi:hypothetical protein
VQRLTEEIVGPVAAGEADHVEAGRQQPLALEVIERRHQLAVRQVAGGAEDHDGARLGGALHPQPGAQRVGHRGCIGHGQILLVEINIRQGIETAR